MSTRPVFATATFVAMALACGVSAARAETPAADRYAAVRSFIQDKVTAGGVPSISVAVFRDGKVEWEEGFGWADREAMIRADADTTYSLASISKPFTATGLMVLARRHVIDLDRPVNDYLGSGKLTARIGDVRQATVRRVASHTAGLPFHVQFFYYDRPFRRPPHDETIARYANIVTPPGARYFYSNLGYGILGDVIERQSHEPYADFMREQVFTPLGLTHTAVDAPLVAALKPYVAARYATDGTRMPWYDTDHPGASEIYSSAHDLIRFAAFNLKARQPGQTAILDDATLDFMHTDASPAGSDEQYGFGFEVSKHGAYRIVSHGGSMPGVATEMLTLPDQGIAIVVLTNTWANDVVGEVTERIAQSLLPNWKAEPAANPFARPAAPFAPGPELAGRWAGDINTPDGKRPMVLELRPDGRVTASINGHGPVLVDAVTFKDGSLAGQLNASVDTRDTDRFRYQLRLDLQLDGERLHGSTLALGNLKDPYIVAGLTYWTDLTRTK